MKFSQFDRFAPYLKGAAVLIALLTYWRFHSIEISGVYAYVAQGDVIRSVVGQGIVTARSIVWDFFGLVDRMITPHEITLLRWTGLLVVIIDSYLASKLLDYILAQKFWGFLGMFLIALSPFAVVAAVSGSSAAAASALALLFLMALYRNQYVYAAMLSAVAVAANLPGLIMFLISVLDLLQNLQERKKLISRLIYTTAGFSAVLALVYLYSLYSGNGRLFSIPVVESDLKWNMDGALALVAANILNIAGIAYVVVNRRYDVYKTHFHTLMLWITTCAVCMAQPSTLNLLVALTVSTILSMFFLQGFSSLWSVRLVSADTFVFVFVVIFLFSDLYSNNTFLKNTVLSDSYQRSEAVSDVVRSVAASSPDTKVVSNFAPHELSVKLGRTVYSVEGVAVPIGGFEFSGSSVVYVAKRTSKVGDTIGRCRLMLTTSYDEGDKNYFVQVVKCGDGK